MPRVLGGSQGGGRFLVSEVPRYASGGVTESSRGAPDNLRGVTESSSGATDSARGATDSVFGVSQRGWIVPVL